MSAKIHALKSFGDSTTVGSSCSRFYNQMPGGKERMIPCMYLVCVCTTVEDYICTDGLLFEV